MGVPTTCPKCGHDKGWKGPRYTTGYRSVYNPDPAGLLYTCRLCGYDHKEPCIDAVKAPVMK